MLYVGKKLPCILRSRYGLRIFDNVDLRDEVTVEWKKLLEGICTPFQIFYGDQIKEHEMVRREGGREKCHECNILVRVLEGKITCKT
jgi:hypothetical protein